MKKSIRGFVAGFLVCGLISTTITFGANGIMKKIFYGINVIVDGKEMSFANDERPFSMDGRTFLPIRTLSDILGKQVEWDTNTSTIYIGETKLNQKTKLADIEVMNSAQTYKWTSNNTDNFSNKYTHGYRFSSSNSSKDAHVEVVLNGKYKKLSAIVTPAFSDEIQTALHFYSLSDEGTKKLYETVSVSRLTQPFQIEVDLTGVNVLRIDWDGQDGNGSSNIGLVNAFLE